MPCERTRAVQSAGRVTMKGGAFQTQCGHVGCLIACFPAWVQIAGTGISTEKDKKEDKAARPGQLITFFFLIIAAKSATEKSHFVIWEIKIYMKWNYIIGKRGRDFKTTASKWNGGNPVPTSPREQTFVFLIFFLVVQETEIFRVTLPREYCEHFLCYQVNFICPDIFKTPNRKPHICQRIHSCYAQC